MNKFKNIQELEKAYKELEKAFTKKCQEAKENEEKIMKINWIINNSITLNQLKASDLEKLLAHGYSMEEALYILKK